MPAVLAYHLIQEPAVITKLVRYCLGHFGVLYLVLFALCFSCASDAAFGQSRERDAKKKEPTASPQQLEARISKAEEQLLDEYLAIANEYYKQGEKDQSIVVLERIAQINPRMEGIRQRIDGIREELIQENGIKTDFDTSKLWLPIAEVEEGKPLRLVVTGDYKLDLTTSVTTGGLPTGDPAKDHVAGAPFGALVGMVFTDGKPGEPFLISGGVEHTPKKTGTLFLRVNVPAVARCKGELKVQASGAVKPVSKVKR